MAPNKFVNKTAKKVEFYRFLKNSDFGAYFRLFQLIEISVKFRKRLLQSHSGTSLEELKNKKILNFVKNSSIFRFSLLFRKQSCKDKQRFMQCERSA